MSSPWESPEMAGQRTDAERQRGAGGIQTLSLTGWQTSCAHTTKTRPPRIQASSEEHRAGHSLPHSHLSSHPLNNAGVCGDCALGQAPGVYTESEHPRILNRGFSKAPWIEEERGRSQIPPVSSKLCVCLNPDEIIVDVARGSRTTTRRACNSEVILTEEGLFVSPLLSGR